MEGELDQVLIFLCCVKVVVKKGVNAQDYRNRSKGNVDLEPMLVQDLQHLYLYLICKLSTIWTAIQISIRDYVMVQYCLCSILLVTSPQCTLFFTLQYSIKLTILYYMYCTALYCISLYCTILEQPVLSSNVLYQPVSSLTVLTSTVLSFVLRADVLSGTVYCDVMYDTELQCEVLTFNVMYMFCLVLYVL